MRRFLLLLGALSLAVGLRLYNNGLINCGYDGTLSVGTYDTVALNEIPLLISGPHRIDIDGGDEDTALKIISTLCGKELFRENVDDIVIIYAYCDRLGDCKKVGDLDVNLMIAITNAGIKAGTPLLYGSY